MRPLRSHRGRKKLYRSRIDRKIAGVCGGLAAYFGLDSTLIRILFIVFLLLGGCAILIYFIFWLVTPLEPFFPNH